MTNSRAGEGNMQDESELVVLESKEILKNRLMQYGRRIQEKTERTPNDQCEKLEHKQTKKKKTQKKTIILDYSSKYKINIHKSLMM